jgi:hypothetical protein
MPTILTTETAVREAAMPDLLATYTHLTGRSVARFASSEVAVRRVIDAMMAATDARGQLGVPQNTKSVAPEAYAALVQRAADTGRADPVRMVSEGLGGSQAGVEADLSANPYPAGTLAARLWAAAAGEPLPPEPPPVRPAPAPAPSAKPAAPAGKRSGLDPLVLVAPGKPGADLSAGSRRAAVFASVRRAGTDGVRLSVLVAEHGAEARGCIGKLRQTNHITISNT